MKINENIAYSRSILNKLNITRDSELLIEVLGGDHQFVIKLKGQ